ncbi:MAG: hypothetical protein HJJLKODD_03013 [Phycisphaerae bacterium]|nr:hypothetical protein [Phycisphaerae bacterium]
MYRWRPTKSQRAAFAGKMADPVMRADYIARKEARAAKHRAGSRFGYPSAGGRCVPTIEQYHQAGRLIVAGPIYDLQGDGDIDSSDAYVAYTLWEQQQSYPALVTLTTSGITNPYLFTGQPLDVIDNGSLYLYHYRARAYDPTHGRFMQRDPAEYVDGMNLYEYVRSIPQFATDPTGEWGEYVHWWLTA